MPQPGPARELPYGHEHAWQGSARSPTTGVWAPNPGSEPMPQTSPDSPRAAASRAETALPSGWPGPWLPVPHLPAREPDTPPQGGTGHSWQRQGQCWTQRHRRQLGRPRPRRLWGSPVTLPWPRAHSLPGTHVLLQDLPPFPGLRASPSGWEAQGPSHSPLDRTRRSLLKGSLLKGGAGPGPASPQAWPQAQPPTPSDPGLGQTWLLPRKTQGNRGAPSREGTSLCEAWEDRSPPRIQPTGAGAWRQTPGCACTAETLDLRDRH